MSLSNALIRSTWACAVMLSPALVAAQSESSGSLDGHDPVPIVTPNVAQDNDSAEAAGLNGGIRDALARHDWDEARKDVAYQQAKAAYAAKLSENQKQQDAAAVALAEWKRQTATADADKAAWTRKFGAQAKLNTNQGDGSGKKSGLNAHPTPRHSRCVLGVTGSLIPDPC